MFNECVKEVILITDMVSSVFLELIVSISYLYKRLSAWLKQPRWKHKTSQ